MAFPSSASPAATFLSSDSSSCSRRPHCLFPLRPQLKFRPLPSPLHLPLRPRPGPLFHPPSPTSSLSISPAPDVQTSLPVSSSWAEFAKNVSGEWDGFGADFTSDGKPIELPESVVPEAYREWEVKVFDWQTQCPTLAREDGETLEFRLIKLLPTVGCEADAATRYSIDERTVGTSDSKASAFAYETSGSYVAVWPVKDNGGGNKVLEVESCLINPQDKETRVRLIQVLAVADGKVTLKSIRVFREQWYGPFRNGEQLGGCAIRDSAFASTTPVAASEVTSLCKGLFSAARDFNPARNLEFANAGMQLIERDDCGLVTLPKQLWCSLKEIDGLTSAQVGWLFEQGQAITSTCKFSSNGDLEEILLARETTSDA
ncbi:hypothetical protein MLD38_022779 [Melastoma candidum]|uniref:Uncharacterized protein n=1 Tax=Melastoma candidum TaxID=119954 RepID=A0ACB9QKK0_9MYRT|nr:hypothetical protein MLD38_022779 [Melastoma candidum]